MKPFWHGAVFLAALLVASCGGNGSTCTTLPGGARYCLQTTAAIEAFDAQQKVDITFGGRHETMIAQLEADADGIRLAGTTPFGQKLLQLGYDNRQLSVDSFPGKGLDPLLLLALIQVATWPEGEVRNGLGGADVVSDTTQRRIVKDGKDIVVIRYTHGRLPLDDMLITFPSTDVEFAITNLEIAAPR